jgi:cell division protein FtsW
MRGAIMAEHGPKQLAGVIAARGRATMESRLGRADRSPIGVWFWELDRVLLGLIVALIAIGLLAVAAASPATAQRLSTSSQTLDPLYFFYRQLMWVAVSVPCMLLVSMLPKDEARRFAILAFGLFLALLILVPVFGSEVNGARRWIGPGFANVQPSEFLKPFFAVTMAWILSWKSREHSIPVIPLTLGITGFIALLLMNQPDLGQTIIFCGIWFTLMLVGGMSVRLLAALVIGGIVLLVAAYAFYPVATQRIDTWLFGGETNDQIMLAYRTITSGGLVGVGPGLGTEKFHLPEAHTDYIFSVIGEEFGILPCIVIALTFLAVIIRVLVRLLDEEDRFVILAATGLVAQFGGQALVNMAVNLQLFPSKGMTLPFISYGGSSLIAIGVGMGLLLAFTKRNPYLDRSRYMMKGASG